MSNSRGLRRYRETESEQFFDENDVDIFHVPSSLRLPLSESNTPPRPRSHKSWTLKVERGQTDLTDLEFSKYKKLSRIGRGAFGSVWKVVHKPTGKVFAMKTVPYHPSKKLQILNEVRIMKNLDHTNIVKLFHYHLGPELNLIMEYCSGGSLFGHVLTENQTAKYTAQVLDVLSYLHKQGVVHRDVKAANLLLEGDQVKLADFGISVNIDNTDELKDPGGSVYWMAPEIVRMQAASPASEIWSVGATVVELLAGQPPFGDLPQEAALHSLRTGEPIQYPQVSRDCSSFLDMCFQWEPSARPTAHELISHRWIVHALMLQKFQETDQDNNYEQDLEKPNLAVYAEDDEDFHDGFASDLEIHVPVKPVGLLDKLRGISKFDDSAMNQLVDDQFVVDLVFNLNRRSDSDEVALEMIRIANHLFEKRPDTLRQFCKAGGIPMVLNLYGKAHRLVHKFLFLLSRSEVGIEYLALAGEYKFLAVLLKRPGEKDLAAMLIHKLLHHKSTPKDLLATTLVAHRVPHILYGLVRTSEPAVKDRILDDLLLILRYCPPTYRGYLLTNEFYQTLETEFAYASMPTRCKIVELFANYSIDIDVKSMLQAVSQDLTTTTNDRYIEAGKRFMRQHRYI